MAAVKIFQYEFTDDQNVDASEQEVSDFSSVFDDYQLDDLCKSAEYALENEAYKKYLHI